MITAATACWPPACWRFVPADRHSADSAGLPLRRSRRTRGLFDKPPPANARDAQAKRIGKNTIQTSDLSYTAALAQQRYPVTLYTFGCGTVCDAASGLLNKRGVPHTVVDVGQNDGAEKLKRLTGGLDAPALQVGDQYASGFSDARWQSMLTEAGYPLTPPLRTTPVGRAPAQQTTPTPAPSASPPSTTPPPTKSGDYPQ